MKRVQSDALMDFFSEMQYEALGELKKSNTVYADLLNQEENYQELAELVFDKLENSDREIVMRYLVVIETRQAAELDHLYSAGYRDCAATLKKFGVL